MESAFIRSRGNTSTPTKINRDFKVRIQNGKQDTNDQVSFDRITGMMELTYIYMSNNHNVQWTVNPYSGPRKEW